MPSTRWQVYPALVVIGGVLLALSCAWTAYEELGVWWYGVLLGAGLSIAGAAWFRRRLSSAEHEVEDLERKLAASRRALAADRQEFEKTRAEAERQLRDHAARLENREQTLARRLLTYHEWMEFPQPIDLSVEDQPDERELSQLAQKDRELMRILREESKRLYDNILENRYSVDGRVQPTLIRDEAYRLVDRVARLYRPEVDNALLETSTAQVLRAASRICLQMLVVLEELPLDVKEYNFSRMYQYVRQAVRAYGYYQASEPYWPLVNSAYYLSRYAMGASPVTLGAWWLASSLGKEGAKRVATRFLNRQGLALLHNMVRVIGYEVAGVYGGDFRTRDPNWIYGVELTELIGRFPLSRDGLSQGLKEIGALELRGEFDRVYLYRCLAAHAPAQPDRYNAKAVLTVAERQAVARRLEHFFASHVHGKTPDRVEAWKLEVEHRLGVRLSLEAPSESHSAEAQLESAIRSLASFLLAVKEKEVEELADGLTHARLFNELPTERRRRALADLADDPPFFFEHPNIDAESELADRYLEDLATLALDVHPRSSRIDEMVADVADYLRHDAKRTTRVLDRRYIAHLERRFRGERPPARVSASVARAVLDVLEPHERITFLYGGVQFEGRRSRSAALAAKENTWLVGVEQEAIAIAVHDAPLIVWRSGDDLEIREDRGYLTSDCVITGGEWIDAAAAGRPTLRVPGGLMTGFERYFRPLLKLAARDGQAADSTAAEQAPTDQGKQEP